LHNDYFSETPTYDASFFRRRCVKLSIFLTFYIHQYARPNIFLILFL
jgi:hypothetical protein